MPLKTNEYRSAAELTLVPAGVVTVTSTVPCGSAGVTAVICWSDTKVKVVASVAPNLTEVTPVNDEPLIVTEV